MRSAMAAPAEDAAAESYEIGEMQFTATVSAQWELQTDGV